MCVPGTIYTSSVSAHSEASGDQSPESFHFCELKMYCFLSFKVDVEEVFSKCNKKPLESIEHSNICLHRARENRELF